jgi:predicted DCC family thiol-disulfide oxidoreductase YuxK
MELDDYAPLVLYDNQCYLCVKFAKTVNFLARGRLRIVGHYTDLGKKLRDDILDSSALEMFWFVNRKTAYGGRAALLPLMSAIIRVNGRSAVDLNIQESCDLDCKTTKAVFVRSASLLTNSKKIKIK